MKFSLECDVESKTKLFDDSEEVDEIEIEHNGRIYMFSSNEEGYLAKIKIISRAENPQLYFSRREPSTEIPAFTFRSDPEMNQMIIREFHLLEGLLAFRANIKSIKWGYPRFEYLPENEEEAQKARLPSISYERRIQKKEAQISGKDLARLIISKDRYSSLTVYLSFYREGVNEYRDYRYLYAFYNFYYILEGLYTRGNTNTIQVKKDFKNSTDMVANVETLISHYSKETPENQTKLLQTLKHRGMRFDVEGIIGLIVKFKR
jgi:hypothetical protein